MNHTLLLVNITGLLVGISYGLHGPILPVFARDVIGASYAELGLIGLANFAPYVVFPLFVGFLLNRFNNGYLLSVGVVINSASVYLISVSQSVPEIMGLRVMSGIAHAFFWPPCESIISNSSTAEGRVRNIARFTGFFVAGFTIGPLLGTLLIGGLDAPYRLLFEIGAFILAAGIVSSLALSQRTQKTTRGDAGFGVSAIALARRFPTVILIMLYTAASFGMILAM